MELEVLRISSGEDSTSGLLFDVTNNRKFLCYTLEDEHRDSYNEKIMSETRIPAGTMSLCGQLVECMKNMLKDFLIFIGVLCTLGMYLILSISLFTVVTLMNILLGVFYWGTTKKTTKSTKMDILEAHHRRISEFIRR